MPAGHFVRCPPTAVPACRLASEWLIYRHRCWPASINPHLPVSRKTALDPDQPAVSVSLLRLDLPRGLTLDGPSQDRILNEAFKTADPSS